jgi:hypothetical protein
MMLLAVWSTIITMYNVRTVRYGTVLYLFPPTLQSDGIVPLRVSQASSPDRKDASSRGLPLLSEARRLCLCQRKPRYSQPDQAPSNYLPYYFGRQPIRVGEPRHNYEF